tara:strand:+ start:881 stop:1954 length:1074 start_codon:yes stop_codon:yes gene_type:complete
MFKILKLSDDKTDLHFDCESLQLSIVNGLRRTILNDITNIGFGYEPKRTIKILKNTTANHDEYLCHRLCMVPVNIEEWYSNPGNVDIEDYTFYLKTNCNSQQKKNGGYVTTDDFIVKKKVNDDIVELNTLDCFPKSFKFKSPILITRYPNRDGADQELELECKLMKGTHSDHAGFSPVVTCVAFKNEEKSTEELIVSTVKVKSIGIWSPYKLVYFGFTNLIEKCKKIYDVIESGHGITKYKGNYKAVNYNLYGESHTMGNIIQDWIYNKEFKESPSGKNISHISYHEPHPLENMIIVRMVLKDDIDDFEAYKGETNRLFKMYLSELETYIENCSRTWKDLCDEKDMNKSLIYQRNKK